MKYHGLLILLAFISSTAHADFAYLSEGNVIDITCSSASDGQIIRMVNPKPKDCPETVYRCSPQVQVKSGHSILLEPQNRTIHLTEFEGGDGVQTRYMKSEQGTFYAHFWAWGSSGKYAGFELFVDMKTCLVIQGSRNVNLSSQIKCSVTVDRDGYFSYRYDRTVVTSKYEYSPCFKIM